MSAAETHVRAGIEELCDIKRTRLVTGQSTSYIYRHLDDETNPFPRPRRIGRKSFWTMSELQAWIARQVEEAPRAGRWVGQEGIKKKKPLESGA